MEKAAERRNRDSVWRRLLLIACGLLTLTVLVQAFLAGNFLTGVEGALEAHRNMAFGVIQWVALAAVVIAILWWKPGGGPTWPILVTVLTLLLIGVQIWVGFADLLQIHIPLGVSIFGLNLWLVSRLVPLQRRYQ